jgi:zinc and cadmium transporter
MILIGDALHNLVDGVVIAAAFLTSVPLGIAAAVAVVAHEVPQEVGDFGILLDAGYPPRKALIWNALSSSTTLVGAAVGYLWLAGAQWLLPYALAVAAASFIYIAIADLVPILHRQASRAAALGQLAMIIAGIATVAAFHAR